MYKMIKASESRLVNLYAKTEDGWKLVFKDIEESVAAAIWEAGFKTGENKFSIETPEGRRVQEMNRKALGK